jgi:hypothetical protein
MTENADLKTGVKTGSRPGTPGELAPSTQSFRAHLRCDRDSTTCCTSWHAEKLHSTSKQLQAAPGSWRGRGAQVDDVLSLQGWGTRAAAGSWRARRSRGRPATAAPRTTPPSWRTRWITSWRRCPTC